MEYVLSQIYPSDKVAGIMKDCYKFGLSEDQILDHVYDDRINPRINELIMKLSVLKSETDMYMSKAHENLPIKVNMNMPNFDSSDKSHAFFYSIYSKKRNNKLINLTFINIKNFINHLLIKIQNAKKMLFVFHILEKFYLKYLQLQPVGTIRKSEFMGIYDSHFNYFVNDVLQEYKYNVYEKFGCILEKIKLFIYKLARSEALSVKFFK